MGNIGRTRPQKTLITDVLSKHAEVVKNAIIKLLEPENELLHTITFGNGKEFAYHAQIKEALGSDNDFTHLYCSWVSSYFNEIIMG